LASLAGPALPPRWPGFPTLPRRGGGGRRPPRLSGPPISGFISIFLTNGLKFAWEVGPIFTLTPLPPVCIYVLKYDSSLKYNFYKMIELFYKSAIVLTKLGETYKRKFAPSMESVVLSYFNFFQNFEQKDRNAF
jgi:hypothetical protein